MSRTTIRVFEHQRLRVGERLPAVEGGHWELDQRMHDTLSRFAEGQARPLLRLGHRSLRFTQFVGFLQVGSLGIEVLPKADRNAPGQATPWRDALLDMLALAHDLRLARPDDARLARERGSLFDAFVSHFLHRVERLLHRGLARGYRRVCENRPVFRGRLRATDNIRHNAVLAHRVFIEHEVYDHDILVNQTLRAALEVLTRSVVRGSLRERLRRVLGRFPTQVRDEVDPGALDHIVLGRRTVDYRDPLAMARMILEHHRPALRSGGQPVHALLFDMNQLWERYVAALLRRVAPPGFRVSAQDSRILWRAKGQRARTVRPDLVVFDGEGATTLLLDTKWKCPHHGRPSSGDLQQMFVYNELYDCPRSLLVYPRSATQDDSDGRFERAGHTCGTRFVSLFESGRYRRCVAEGDLRETVDVFGRLEGG